jgi:hypothetical protein
MTICYIRWKDALAVEGDNNPAVAELAELEEVGFLLDESNDAVLIGMEALGETPGRWRINIPRGQIVEMREMRLEKAFPKRSIRK